MEHIPIFLTGAALSLAVWEICAWSKRHRSVGVRARDILMDSMSAHGMPCCARPVFRQGPLVVIGIGFDKPDHRHYVIDMTSDETAKRDAANACMVERAGKKGG